MKSSQIEKKDNEQLFLKQKIEKKSGPIDIPDFSFSDLVDISDLQDLVNNLAELAGCATSVLDANNNILASAGWQKICTCFHRIHPETNKFCSESDSYIKQNLETENPIAFKCKNGLREVAYPVFIDGKHLATIFFGQFFFDDEVIDKSHFEIQAGNYGFDKTEYISYLGDVPVLSRKKVEILKNFSTTLAHVLIKEGYSNLVLKKEKSELHSANKQIQESELKFRKLFEHAGVGVAQVGVATGKFLKVNKKFADMLGYSINEMLHLNFQSITHPDDLEGNLYHQNLLLKKQISEYSTEKRYIGKNGEIIWVIITVSSMSEISGGDEYHILIVQDITERKKSEQALLESELKFRKLFENAGVGVAQADPSSGKFLRINKKFAEMLGYSIDELLQMSFKSITHPEDIQGNRHNIKLLIKKQITEFSQEKRYIRKNGTILWAIITVSTIGVEDSDGMNHMAIIHDITERKKSEQDLIVSELKFRKLFEQAGVGVAQVETSNGRFVKINKKYADILGYSIEELQKLSFLDFTHVDDIDECYQLKAKFVFDQNTEFSIDLRFIRKDGTVVWVKLTETSMWENIDGINHRISIIQDITDHKKSEQDLLNSELKFRKLFEQAGVGVAQIDSSSGQFVKINKKYADILGYSIEEMKQLSFLDFTHPDDIEESVKYKCKFINENNTGFSIDKRWIRKDGKMVWVKITESTLWEDEGGAQYHISIVQDISDTKKAELDLIENEAKLYDLNNTKDKFFSIIAHDLKNPFAVLKSSSELLYKYLEKNDLSKSKVKAEQISKASNHGYALLENLLVWAKSQTQGIKFEPQQINFKNKVTDNITEVEGRASEKNICITNEIPDDMILEADENLLSVVFRNLLTNAIKFTHSGGMITVTAKIENNLVEVAVIDTGIGIPKEYQYKLFRLDTNFSREGTANEASSSLGLILCKEFIEKHKGRIWVESEAHKGSEFRFTLPYIQPENNSPHVS